MSKRPGSSNSLRIIGGRWRSRRLSFPSAAGLRPTPDRVRETVFNWLQMALPAARCLDLFAGSGALGLEALSRDAAEVVMVDKDSKVVRQLRDNGHLLQARGLQVVQADARRFLDGEPRPFDIVFLDPPFRHNLLAECMSVLEHQGWLSPSALIYAEAEKELGPPQAPENWELLREKGAGQVVYRLYRRHDNGQHSNNE